MDCTTTSSQSWRCEKNRAARPELKQMRGNPGLGHGQWYHPQSLTDHNFVAL